jgi:hypothetical protein
MSNDKNTGGPAFPTAMEEHVDGILHYDQPGMTLRDHFAGLAMQGMWAGGLVPLFATKPDADHRDFMAVSRKAYAMADAMLKAREQ